MTCSFSSLSRNSDSVFGLAGDSRLSPSLTLPPSITSPADPYLHPASAFYPASCVRVLPCVLESLPCILRLRSPLCPQVLIRVLHPRVLLVMSSRLSSSASCTSDLHFRHRYLKRRTDIPFSIHPLLFIFVLIAGLLVPRFRSSRSVSSFLVPRSQSRVSPCFIFQSPYPFTTFPFDQDPASTTSSFHRHFRPFRSLLSVFIVVPPFPLLP